MIIAVDWDLKAQTEQKPYTMDVDEGSDQILVTIDCTGE